jgi:hypothetical protein
MVHVAHIFLGVNTAIYALASTRSFIGPTTCAGSTVEVGIFVVASISPERLLISSR